MTKYRSSADGQVSFGGGLGRASQIRLGFNSRRCLTFGKSLVIVQPGSHLSTDARAVTITFNDGGTHTRTIGQPLRRGLGGAPAHIGIGQTIPEFSGGQPAADCGVSTKHELQILEGADPLSGQ